MVEEFVVPSNQDDVVMAVDINKSNDRTLFVPDTVLINTTVDMSVTNANPTGPTSRSTSSTPSMTVPTCINVPTSMSTSFTPIMTVPTGLTSSTPTMIVPTGKTTSFTTIMTVPTCLTTTTAETSATHFGVSNVNNMSQVSYINVVTLEPTSKMVNFHRLENNLNCENYDIIPLATVEEIANRFE
ncbi:hypothetical protein Tco_1321847, partial [Tanacetum coccineum]